MFCTFRASTLLIEYRYGDTTRQHLKCSSSNWSTSKINPKFDARRLLLANIFLQKKMFSNLMSGSNSTNWIFWQEKLIYGLLSRTYTDTCEKKFTNQLCESLFQCTTWFFKTKTKHFARFIILHGVEKYIFPFYFFQK